MSRYDAHTVEDEVEEFWDSNDVYRKAKESRKGNEKHYFLDGPPYVTGAIHLGTAWNKILKDTYLRYKRMQGYDVRSQPGFDMHGLPIEVKVEKSLDLDSKREIEEIGVDNFINKCKSFAKENLDKMREQFKMLGVWMDWDDPYMTIKNDYLRSAWWTVKKAWEKDLLEKEKRSIRWCPRCQTALAKHEVRGEYENVEDPSIYVKMRLKDKKDEYVLIWTTTPWTIPANLAVAVDKDFNYARVKIKSEDEVLIMANELVDDLMDTLEIDDYEVLEILKGHELQGMEYEHPLEEHYFNEDILNNDKTHSIVLTDFVTLDEGTGCVHMAPGHGEEDYEAGKELGLPIYCPVDQEGKYTEGLWEGINVKEADEDVMEELKDRGNLIYHEPISHEYPHCWRCDTPLIFRAEDQWFLKVSKVKDEILEKNSEDVEWLPEWAGQRYENGVETSEDWCLSRQRYWGIPMPIWECEECGNREVIGDVDEIDLDPEVDDLHRPHVDEATFECEECGGTMQRIPDVIDVWFDSGIASWASIGYPMEKGEFEDIWPADFIVEGHDQVSKWFYSQQVASVLAFDEVPYEKVAMHGFTLDPNGDKMSKSVGNIIAPEEVIEEYGRDILRFYLMSATVPWRDLTFSWDEVDNVQKMMNTLWNVFSLTKTYMDLDNFDPEEDDINYLEEDKWILSRLNSTKKKIESEFKTFRLNRGLKELKSFIMEDLSRWYVKLIRKRLWIEEDDPKKTAAFQTLYRVFKNLLAIMAPFTPYIADKIYKDLIRTEELPESVHILEWPELDFEDQELENQMSKLRDVVEAGFDARQKAEINLRWPVRNIKVETEDETTKEAVKNLKRILLDRMNVKSVKLGEVERKLLAEPNYSELGPDFRDNANEVGELIEESDAEELLENIESKGKFELNGYEIEKRHVEFKEESPDEFSMSDFSEGKVFVDKRQDREIKAEGLAQEVVRRVQEMRKDLDLDLEERIIIEINIEKEDLIEGKTEYIKKETRSDSLKFVESPSGYNKSWDKIDASIGIRKK